MSHEGFLLQVFNERNSESHLLNWVKPNIAEADTCGLENLIYETLTWGNCRHSYGLDRRNTAILICFRKSAQYWSVVFDVLVSEGSFTAGTPLTLSWICAFIHAFRLRSCEKV